MWYIHKGDGVESTGSGEFEAGGAVRCVGEGGARLGDYLSGYTGRKVEAGERSAAG